MKEKNVKKHSAIKKLIPAVGMLAMSAVMLSSATYAWFTMNKEVQLTGLNMTATTGDGMEISLGAIDAVNNITFSGATFNGNHPYDNENEKGWKSAVVVGNYYSDVGKLKPASSTDGVKFFDATDASDGGRQASTFNEITLDENTTMAELKTKSSYTQNDAATLGTENVRDGYYVDIPVHLRTSKVKTGSEVTSDIYYKMIINNNNVTGKELYKAVRVAFIPITTGTGSSTNIFTSDDDLTNYYTAGTTHGKAVSSETEKSEVTILKNNFVGNGTTFLDGVGADSGLKIPLAENPGEYGHLDFTVRVWLEGESKACYNDNAGQSWNISFAFSLNSFNA